MESMFTICDVAQGVYSAHLLAGGNVNEISGTEKVVRPLASDGDRTLLGNSGHSSSIIQSVITYFESLNKFLQFRKH